MIAIVGGGWFGCHIACCLQDRGIPFTLFEARKRLFDGASGYNQNRLHQGFHYPRSAATRKQSRDGFYEFTRRYPELSDPVEHNIYAVTRESLVDWETYRMVMLNAGPLFVDVHYERFGLQNIEGALCCRERVVLTNKAREFFTAKIGEHMRHQRFNESRIGEYKTVINCTYQTWLPRYDVIYEPCATLLYACKTDMARNQAITLMDGPFCSVYPFDNGLSTLYSVKQSRIAGAKCTRPDAAQSLLMQVDTKQLCGIRYAMEAEIRMYYPSFLDHYEFEGWHGAVRAISRSRSDARVCSVSSDGHMIQVMSGKIDSIFHAEREVLKCLGVS
jgi:hypothetical protein